MPMIVSQVTGEYQILDYSQSQLLAIETGEAKIQNGEFKFIHPINLKRYENIVAKLETTLKRDTIKKHPKFPFFEYELQQLIEGLDELKPKKFKRSIDILGSAIQLIAGNPDHEDFELMTRKINNIIDSHNNQIIINEKQNQRINEITETTNKILHMIHSEGKFDDRIASQIQYQLKILKEEINNIRVSIHWAKKGIINSLLLSKSEIIEILNILKKDNIPYQTAEEALNFANVNVIFNSSFIIFLIKIPMTTEETFSKLLKKTHKKIQYH
jgi:Gypsy protein